MCWLKESNELGVRYLYEVRTGLLLIVLWSLFSIRSRSSQQRPSAVNFERKNLVKMLTYLCMLRFFLHFFSQPCRAAGRFHLSDITS